MKTIIVTGAVGFIAVHQVPDLRLRENCYRAVSGYNEVFNLAALPDTKKMTGSTGKIKSI